MYHHQLTQAARHSQSTLAQIAGMAPGASGNLLGPDGRPYTGVVRAASAFEMASIGREMQSHGFQDREILILTCTRDQFTAPPLAWRRQEITLLTRPPKRCAVHSLSTSDPLHYAFVLITRQGAAS